jgi:hypothetical protein
LWLLLNADFRKLELPRFNPGDVARCRIFLDQDRLESWLILLFETLPEQVSIDRKSFGQRTDQGIELPTAAS